MAEELTPAAQRWVVALMAISYLIVTADFSIASVALPSIGRDLHVDPALLSWIVVASSLANAGLLMVGGKLVDRLGHHIVLTAGLAIYGLASLIACVTPAFGLLLVARAAQGGAIALISPASFSLITAFLPEGPARHRALGVFGMTQGVSLVLGLFVGGWVVTAFGWRAVFLVPLPTVCIAILLALRILPRRIARRPVPIGAAAAILSTLVMVTIVSAISAIGTLGLLAPRTLGLLGGGIVLIGGFLLAERRSSTPMVPPMLWRRPGFALSAWAFLFFLGGVGGLFVLSQIAMQRVLGLSAAQAGLGMLPYAVAVMIAGRIAPLLLARLPVRTIVLGAAVVNAAGLLFLAASAGQPYAMSIAPGVVICALGSVSAFIALMHAAMAGLPEAEQGVGTAILFVCQQLGVAIGASTAMVMIEQSGATADAGGLRMAFAVLAGGIAIAFVSILAGLRGTPVPAPIAAE